MTDNSDTLKEIADVLSRLSPKQVKRIKELALAFAEHKTFWRAKDSDLISQEFLENFGDRLISHHASSRQPLSKDRFEFAFESALNESGITAELVKSRTNRGHDLTVSGVTVSLKTEAASNIKDAIIHVSKWMELGKGEWELALLRSMFLDHLKNYDRIFTLRCLSFESAQISYELVEIPKALLLESAYCELEIKNESKQKPKPGYGWVRESNGDVKFALYFDGGTERKLQIKGLKKSLCKVHATWQLSSTIFY
jgi:hypothetical protein